MYHQEDSRQAEVMALRILKSLTRNKALTIPEACFAAGKGSSGNLALKLDYNCFILIGGSKTFQIALNYLLDTDQVVLRKADPRLYKGDAICNLPLVEKPLTCTHPSWFSCVVTLP